jgi:uroporphyrinogen III methyltransferase/synthase
MDYKQEGLVEAFKKREVKGQKILFVRAKEGRDLLIDFLTKKGATVDLWALYENKIPAGTKHRLVDLFQQEGGIDLLTFASSSSADNFYSVFTPAERKKWLKSLPVAVIGPVTGRSVKKWGGRVVVMPRQATMPGLLSALAQWVKRQKPMKY